MTQDDIARIDALMAKATPGEWQYRPVKGHTISDVFCAAGGITDGIRDEDAALIVALHNAWPEISATLARESERGDINAATLDKTQRALDAAEARLSSEIEYHAETTRHLAMAIKRIEQAEARLRALDGVTAEDVTMLREAAVDIFSDDVGDACDRIADVLDAVRGGA